MLGDQDIGVSSKKKVWSAAVKLGKLVCIKEPQQLGGNTVAPHQASPSQ